MSGASNYVVAPEDFDELVALQTACFPGMIVWKREHIESQIKNFSREGNLVIDIDGRIAAFCVLASWLIFRVPGVA
ncbi:MAG: hypothetical protein R3C68_11425 [Myxococcota bacterium]